MTSVEFDSTKVAEAVAKAAKARGTKQGWSGKTKLDHEIDFMCGAAAVFFALGKGEEIPAKWFFGPLGNDSPFKEASE